MDRYEIRTGLTGFLTLWVGVAVQISTLVVLAAVSGTSSVPFGVAVAAYWISMAIYFVFDIAWVLAVEQRVLSYFLSRNDHPEPGLERPVLLGIFFLFAAAANTFVVILPGLDERGSDKMLPRVALRAFAMGLFAYANLGLVQAWGSRTFPLEVLGIMPLSGGLLSLCSSLLTTLICEQML